MSTEKSFTAPIKCGHCRNVSPMEIGATYSTIRQHDDDASDIVWEEGTAYEIVVCPACERVTFRSGFWHENMDPSEVEYVILYPSGERALHGLPQKIAKAYQAAQKVRNIDANAYGVLLGRVLEFVCEDRTATGDTLDKKLKSLAGTSEIPPKLVEVAAGLRKLRNIGAHASFGELTEKELPVLDDLTRAILDYVYFAPYLAKEAEGRLARLSDQGE
jgi:hypothetical protein